MAAALLRSRFPLRHADCANSPLIILLIKKDQTVEANGDGNRLRAFRDENAGKTRTCIAVLKWVMCAGSRRIAARLFGSDGEFLFSRSG